MARKFDEVAINDPVGLAAMGLTKADIDLIKNGGSGGGGGGVTNTGDATEADVATGKTFSSASLTNATGTSTKNATIPDNAPIQPPQAFVALMMRWANPDYGLLNVNMSGLGIVSFVPGYIYSEDFSSASFCLPRDGTGAFDSPVDASNNALGEQGVDNLLAELAWFDFDTGPSFLTVVVDGGTNAAPSEHDLQISGCGTAALNVAYRRGGIPRTGLDDGSLINGKHHYASIGGAGATARTIHWTGTRWEIANQDGSEGSTFDQGNHVLFYSEEDVATPDLVETWTADHGSNPPPAFTACNAGKQTLIDRGGTVTTN